MIGSRIKLSLFGESHGEGVGIVVEGFPAGQKVDEKYIESELKRRRGGLDDLTTPRLEQDTVKFVSGVFHGKTTGAPLCIFIPNENQRSEDYDKSTMRPGHADYTAHVKYSGNNDYRGGGHFSGRLTAPIVVAGALAKKYLKQSGIKVGAHIYSIKNVADTPFGLAPALEQIGEDFPVLNSDAGERMQAVIRDAVNRKDSVGGIIEAAVTNLPPGLGEPFWNGVESELSRMLFSIPAVKGVEFGAGFKLAEMYGSEAQDEMYYESGVVKTYANNNGGICGGITSGMPLIVRLAIKPTSSIGIRQQTVDIEKKENTKISINGRHDPCIVKRAVPVVEAVLALGIMDLM